MEEGAPLARTEERGQRGRVQATNDEATLSKASAVARGYFPDPHLAAFAAGAPARTALVNRCYHARVSAVRAVLRGFLAEAANAAPGGRVQVVSLGAGFGTDGFLALREGWGGPGLRWYDCDFLPLARRKAGAIRASPELRSLLRLPDEAAARSGDAGDADVGGSPRVLSSKTGYCLLGLDLRDLKAAEAALRDHGELDFGCPTLLLSECVLNYLTRRQCERVLAWAVRRFARAVFLSYDQMRLRDAFGQAMAGCLRSRGSPLQGLEGGLRGPDSDAAADNAVETEESALRALQERLERQGWCACGAASMSYVCRSWLPVVDSSFRQAQALEAFDEFEEWDIQCSHYGLTWGLTPAAVTDPVLQQGLARFPSELSTEGGPAAVQPAAAEGAPVLRLTGLPPPPRPAVHGQKKPKRGAGRAGLRFGQASVGLPEGRVVAVGGFGCSPGGAQGRLGNVLLLEPFRSTLGEGRGEATAGSSFPWREIPCLGEPLSARTGHAAAALTPPAELLGRVAIFGGREAPGMPLGDLCVLDLLPEGGGEWSNVTLAAEQGLPGHRPPPRWRHTLTMVGHAEGSGADVVLLFGGWDGSAALGDAYVLEVQRGGSGGCSASWGDVVCTGQRPACRFGHTVTRLAPPLSHGGLSRLLLFGGRDGERIIGDAFLLTIQEPRAYGEPWALHCEELCGSPRPAPRYAHAACFLRGEEGEGGEGCDTVLVIGGCTGAGDGPAAFALSCSSWKWQEVRVAGDVTRGRQGDVMWVRQGLHCGPDGRAVALIGGGGVCLGFGSHYNPIAVTGTVISSPRATPA